MIFIESLLLDVTNLKNRSEIESFVKARLVKYFPEPERLLLDIIVTGNSRKKTALVTYTLDNQPTDFNHPNMLFKSVLKKDGRYRIFTSDKVYEYEIDSRVVINHSSLELGDYIELKDSDVVEIRNPDKLYKKCSYNLFKEESGSVNPAVITISTIFILLALTILNFGRSYSESIDRVESIKKEYETAVSETNRQGDLTLLHQELMEIALNNQSQIPPDYYRVFSELDRGEYKIINMSVNKRFITANALAVESFTVMEELNRSPFLELKQNSTVTKDGYEEFSFSGEVLCP